MSKIERHQDRPEWRKAVDLATRGYRLAEQLDAAGNQRLADHLSAALSVVPGLLVIGSPGEADRRLLEAETLLLVAARLGDLAEQAVTPALALIGELRGIPATPAPTVVPNAPPPPLPSVSAPGREVRPQVEAKVSPVGPAREPAPPAPARPAAIAPPEPGKDRLIVDGCNFLGRAPGYSLGDTDSRDRLLFRLQEYAHHHPAHRVTVFFDGQRATSAVIAGVEQRITSERHNADDRIVEFLRLLPRPDRSRTTLVTDDRELADRARREGVRVEAVAWLLEKTARKAARFVPRAQGVNDQEMNEWEQFFNAPPKRPGKQR